MQSQDPPAIDGPKGNGAGGPFSLADNAGDRWRRGVLTRGTGERHHRWPPRRCASRHQLGRGAANPNVHRWPLTAESLLLAHGRRFLYLRDIE